MLARAVFVQIHHATLVAWEFRKCLYLAFKILLIYVIQCRSRANKKPGIFTSRAMVILKSEIIESLFRRMTYEPGARPHQLPGSLAFDTYTCMTLKKMLFCS